MGQPLAGGAQASARPAPATGRTSLSSTMMATNSQNPKLECEDRQCAEEQCDPEECGDENRGPRDDNKTCGIDRRPLLPVVLVASTVLGGVCMFMVQLPIIGEYTGGTHIVRACFLVLYVATVFCLAYCALADPGQVVRDDTKGDATDAPVPKRGHKTWLYKLPVRRYDHYCRWVTNVIGLLNHREFIVMCVGLVTIGVLGGLVDSVIIVFFWREEGMCVNFILLAHLAYSVILTVLAYPILALHIGFVCRNELANEWKKNIFYVVENQAGETVLVNDLSDDEFNNRFDSFQYDRARNAFDKGTSANCWTFWCATRWSPSQNGEF